LHVTSRRSDLFRALIPVSALTAEVSMVARTCIEQTIAGDDQMRRADHFAAEVRS
jgi:hypothetical protein